MDIVAGKDKALVLFVSAVVSAVWVCTLYGVAQCNRCLLITFSSSSFQGWNTEPKSLILKIWEYKRP